LISASLLLLRRIFEKDDKKYTDEILLWLKTSCNPDSLVDDQDKAQ
jgi:hypothetical protein